MPRPDQGLRLLSAAILLLGAMAPISIAGINIALAAATTGLLLHFAAAGTPRPWNRTGSNIAPLLWLYIGVGVITALTGVSLHSSIGPLRKDLHKLWAYYLLLASFSIAPNRKFPVALGLGFVFVSAFGIFQSCWASWMEYLARPQAWAWIRASGFAHPVTYGELLALGLLGALSWLAWHGKDSARRRPVLLLLALVGTAFLLNQTRAAFISLLAGFAAMCAAKPDLRRWLGWSLLTALAGAVLLELLPTHRSLVTAIRQHIAGIDNAQFDRLTLWRVAWDIFKEHPWLGVGPGNFETVFPRYFDGLIANQRIWSSAHNLFLHQLAERGLAGLCVLLALCAGLLGRAWRRCRTQPGPWSLWALAATTAFLVMNLTETAFQNEQVTTFFLLVWVRAEIHDDA